jgi:hypothetical protein
MEKYIIRLLVFLIIFLLTYNMSGIFEIIMYVSAFGLGWTLGDILKKLINK